LRSRDHLERRATWRGDDEAPFPAPAGRCATIKANLIRARRPVPRRACTARHAPPPAVALPYPKSPALARHDPSFRIGRSARRRPRTWTMSWMKSIQSRTNIPLDQSNLGHSGPHQRNYSGTSPLDESARTRIEPSDDRSSYRAACCACRGWVIDNLPERCATWQPSCFIHMSFLSDSTRVEIKYYQMRRAQRETKGPVHALV
jgi:hypothetical protein